MSRYAWLTPLIGILFVVVLFVGFVIQGEPPGADDGAEEIVDYYVDNETETFVGSALLGLAGALFVLFAAYLRSVFRAVEGRGGGASLVSFAGAVIFAVGLAIDATISVALVEAADDVDPAALVSLQALWDNDFVPFALGVFLFLLGTGIAILRTGLFPKWLGWVAIALVILEFTPLFFVPLLGAGLLVIVLSVMLAVQATRETPAAPAA